MRIAFGQNLMPMAGTPAPATQFPVPAASPAQISFPTMPATPAFGHDEVHFGGERGKAVRDTLMRGKSGAAVAVLLFSLSTWGGTQIYNSVTAPDIEDRIVFFDANNKPHPLEWRDGKLFILGMDAQIEGCAIVGGQAVTTLHGETQPNFKTAENGDEVELVGVKSGSKLGRFEGDLAALKELLKSGVLAGIACTEKIPSPKTSPSDQPQ